MNPFDLQTTSIAQLEDEISQKMRATGDNGTVALNQKWVIIFSLEFTNDQVEFFFQVTQFVDLILIHLLRKEHSHDFCSCISVDLFIRKHSVRLFLIKMRHIETGFLEWNPW